MLGIYLQRLLSISVECAQYIMWWFITDYILLLSSSISTTFFKVKFFERYLLFYHAELLFKYEFYALDSSHGFEIHTSGTCRRVC